VPGEAILSAENGGKPSGCRGSARTPLGSSQCSSDPLAGGEWLLPLSKNAHPALGLRLFGLALMKNPGHALGLSFDFESTAQRPFNDFRNESAPTCVRVLLRCGLNR